MAEDDSRDGNDGGQSNFSVIVDQKAEQDYAVNVFKGSGNMSEIFHSDKPQTAPAPALTKKVAKPAKVDETTAMYEWSASVANEA